MKINPLWWNALDQYGQPVRWQVYFWIVVSVALAGMTYIIWPAITDHLVQTERLRVDNVVGVLMHEPGRYTLEVQNPGSPVVVNTPVDTYYREYAQIVTDAPNNAPMWAVLIVEHYSAGRVFTRGLELHVHSVQDINGAGWDHGKFGSGQTTRIR